jgi:phosphate:Na+ symporter
MPEIVLSIIGGLVLFLYGVSSISETIRQAVGDDTQKWLLRFTANVFTGIITGTIITIILDSSSAVIIITIVLVNSKLLTFRQAMGIVLGANIGTTFSSQIIAVDIGKYSPVLLLIGFILLLVTKSVRLNNIGKIILYFGILFFGLYTMEEAVEPLKKDPYFVELLKNTDNPLTGAFTGMFMTLIIQSSSATVGMAIILCKKGILTLAGGVAVMLGAELGTCSDTLIATIRGSRQAIKTGLFHLIFNLLSIITGLLLFYPFVNLVEFISGDAPIERALANAHMIFNIMGVVVFVWFLPFFEVVLNYFLPEKSAYK